MKKLFSNIIFLTLPSLILLFAVLELFFRWGIPACERPNAGWNHKYKLLQHDTIPRDGQFTIGKFAQQRGIWHINNHSWNSSLDYYPKELKTRIAVIGDSYVEAFQVDIDKSFHHRLRAAMPEIDVYNFGVSGASLSHYLHMGRYVNKEFDPDVFIFTLTHNDFDESILQLPNNKQHYMTLDIQKDAIIEVKPITPNLKEIRRDLKLFFKKSAFIRYLWINLKLDNFIYYSRSKEREKYFQNNIDIRRIEENYDLIQKSTTYIFNQFASQFPDKRLIFLMDGPRYSIYKDTPVSEEIGFLHELIAAQCTTQQFDFIDLTNYFKTDFQKNQILFNSKLDGHWNQYGHFLVSEVLIQYLEENNKRLN